MPRVSIITVAYNAEPFIAQAVESVLAQSETDFELIVVDNASTDGTRAVVENYAYRDSRVRLIARSENFGPGYGRNAGIRAATGDWVAVLDADDWYHPDRLATLLDAAEADGADVVADNQFFIMDGAARPYRMLRKEGALGRRLTAEDLLRGDRCGMIGSLGLFKPVIRRRFLQQHGIEYDETGCLSEDFYLLLTCLRYTPFLRFVAAPLYYYRIHPRSFSNSLTLPAVRGMRALHERHLGLFDHLVAPATARLMRRRSRQIDRYVAYRVLIDPLRRGNIRKCFYRMAANPFALPMLVEGFLRYLVLRHQAARYRASRKSPMAMQGAPCGARARPAAHSG